MHLNTGVERACDECDINFQIFVVVICFLFMP